MKTKGKEHKYDIFERKEKDKETNLLIRLSAPPYPSNNEEKDSLFVAQKLLRCRGQPPMKSHVTYIYVAYFQRKHLYFKYIRVSN